MTESSLVKIVKIEERRKVGDHWSDISVVGLETIQESHASRHSYQSIDPKQINKSKENSGFNEVIPTEISQVVSMLILPLMSQQFEDWDSSDFCIR